MRFDYTVSVECETAEQAEQVMVERLEYDEDYGFPYQLTHPQRVNDEHAVSYDGEEMSSGS